MTRGFILIVVIALLGVLAFVSTAFVGVTAHSKRMSSGNINQIRAEMISVSGYEYVTNKILQTVTSDAASEIITVGSGTYRPFGDIVSVDYADLNGRININDGIKAGHLEVANPLHVQDDHFKKYHANALDPYPRGTANNPKMQDPIKVVIFGYPPVATQENIEIYEKARSALINLRLRRLLNAYGDVHRFIDQSYDGDYNNLILEDYSIEQFAEGVRSLPVPVFSTGNNNSASSNRGVSYSGQQLLEVVEGGGGGLQGADTYNNGLGDRIIEKRPGGGYLHLDEIKDIVNQWAIDPGIEFSHEYLKGSTFFDLINNDLTTISYEDDRFFRLDDETRFGDFHKSFNMSKGKSKGNFVPQDLHLNPPNFENMWKHHSVPLINLNAASFFVKAAVFYAPTNVSYHCESATTIPAYGMPHEYTNYLDTHTALESMIMYPNIGVAPPVFEVNKEKNEHGRQNKGRESHLLTMRDALNMAYKYKKYSEVSENQDGGDGSFIQEPININSFDEFTDFLKTFHPITKTPPDVPWQGIVKFERTHNDNPRFYMSSEPYDHAKAYGVSEFEDHGIFLPDYAYKTLPHILSCVRRIPGYLGAPAALQSPYLVIKPDINKHQQHYFDKQTLLLCEQPFRKVEDFVWRFTHPKVCFISCGYYEINLQSVIVNETNERVASSHIRVQSKVFETNYFRTQKDFVDLTDQEKTSEEIRIGPEFLIDQEPSEFIGFVGLDDFEDDLDPTGSPSKRDIYMTQEGRGYSPQIVLNFNPETEDPDAQGIRGFKNSSVQPMRPIPQDSSFSDTQSDSDPWIEALNGANPNDNPYDFLRDSNMEGSSVSIFSSTSTKQLFNDLSPFGGARFSSINHGEFNFYQKFSDSLYFRLDPWLKANGDNPVGEGLSAGLMTFWFQVPCGYDYPTIHVPRGLDDQRNLVSFTRVIASLNVWETYEFNDSHETIKRPVSITVGLRKKVDSGLNIFARYDSGAESYNQMPSISYRAPDQYLNLTQAIYSDSLDKEYNMLGFLCDRTEDVVYQEAALSYESYRRIAHRGAEASLRLSHLLPECGPGSWHRASVYWNLYWDQDNTDSQRQLYVMLHDYGNVPTNYGDYSDVKIYPTEYYQQTLIPPLHLISDPGVSQYPYPRDPNGVDGRFMDQGGNIGMTHPFNETMILSFGEAHGLRMHEYKIKVGSEIDPQTGEEINEIFVTNTRGDYVPFWRFNSCIDNVRVYLGPSDPLKNNLPQNYFDADFLNFTVKNNAYRSMRYRVMRTGNDHHGAYTDESYEPAWVIDPQIGQGAKLVSMGVRAYYPPRLYLEQGGYVLNTVNTPYVKVGASNTGNLSELMTVNVDVSQNEQDLIYSGTQVGSDFKLFVQYQAEKPYLDGDLSTKGSPLNYTDYSNKIEFTDIAWLKEVSLRYQPQGGAKILKWNDHR